LAEFSDFPGGADAVSGAPLAPSVVLTPKPFSASKRIASVIGILAIPAFSSTQP
jgi:hypothetical protein